jgi:predicted lipoprotein with Yx(FWY)xxD motif
MLARLAPPTAGRNELWVSHVCYDPEYVWEDQVRTASIATVVPIVAALLAGCGSSSKSTTSAAPRSTATSTSTPAATSSTPTATAALVTTKQNKLGTVLAVGPKKLTVYLFEADTGSKSTCAGACASVWPPVTTTGQPRTGGHAVASDLGTVTRSDGTVQVTYKGHPLYFYAKDGDVSDAYGQGIKSFGAGWYVLGASGNKIDKS